MLSRVFSKLDDLFRLHGVSRCRSLSTSVLEVFKEEDLCSAVDFFRWYDDKRLQNVTMVMVFSHALHERPATIISYIWNSIITFNILNKPILLQMCHQLYTIPNIGGARAALTSTLFIYYSFINNNFEISTCQIIL